MKRIALFFLSLMICLSACAVKQQESPAKAENVDTSTSSGPVCMQSHSEPESEPADIMPPIEGQYIRLKTEQELTSRSYSNILEIGDLLLCCFHDDTVEAFSLLDGSSIYTVNLDGEGKLFRIEKNSEMKGYDYRLMYEDHVVYRNSQNPDIAMFQELPDGLQFDTDSFSSLKGYYDINNTAFIWADESGIRMSAPDGDDAELILNNDTLPAAYPDCVSELSYNNPRFLSDGSKIAIGVFHEDDQMYFSVIVYNILLKEVEHRIDFLMPDDPVYPINGHYVVVRASNGVQILDAETGDLRDYRLESRNYPYFYSCDYETLIIAKYDSTDFDGFRSYVCATGEPDNENKQLLFVTDDSAVYIRNVTENYVIFSDEENRWVCASRYSL